MTSCTGLQANGFAGDWITVGVDLHETGRSGFTAYWGCPAAVGGTASDRRWMGSVGDWPMASLTAEQQGATTRRGHRHGRCSALSPPPGAPKPHGP